MLLLQTESIVNTICKQKQQFLDIPISSYISCICLFCKPKSKLKKIFYPVYTERFIPDAVSYLMGIFKKTESKDFGLLAPLYYEKSKDLYLFSHHPQGKVWQVSSKLSTTPMRVVFDSDMSCPDSSNEVTWEWFNTTTAEGQQIYIKDEHIKVKCIDNFS